MTKINYQKPSAQTQEEALKMAKGTQRPVQTKEHTKLIAQGIQKGSDLYKKQQKEKARELSRKLKKLSGQKQPLLDSDDLDLDIHHLSTTLASLAVIDYNVVRCGTLLSTLNNRPCEKLSFNSF